MLVEAQSNMKTSESKSFGGKMTHSYMDTAQVFQFVCYLLKFKSPGVDHRASSE